jgi:hypothetical protein
MKPAIITHLGLNTTAAESFFFLGAGAVYGLVHNSLKSISRSNTIAALEGVLAQDQLNEPEPPHTPESPST